MKKRFLLMAMAGVALAGCVSEDVAEVKQKDEKVKIAFDSPVTYTNGDSRVNWLGEIGSHSYNNVNYTYPKDEEFVIYAVWDNNSTKFDGWGTQSEFAEFNENTIKYQSFVDSWAPKKGTNDSEYYYWVDNKVLSYAAYSPADMKDFYTVDLSTGTKTKMTGTPTNYNQNVKIEYGIYDDDETKMGLQITNFETPTNPAFHYELLFSELSLNKTSANMNHSAGKYSGLPVVFQHALSCVRFSLHTDEETANVYLQKIMLGGVKITNGIFKENITVQDSWSSWVYDRKESDEDTQYSVAPEWTFADGATVKSIDTDPFVVYECASGTNGAQFIAEPAFVRAQKGVNDTYYDLYLIPQSLQDVMIEIWFKVGEGTLQKKRYNLSGHYLYTDTDKESAITKLEIGKRYTFRLYYSSAAAKYDKILFSPSTDAWTDVSGIVVDLAHTGTAVTTGAGEE